MSIYNSSEDWVNDYSETVRVCLEHIDSSDGYLGLFASWYGSGPPQQPLSITHLEFRHALARWGKESYPRMAVFMPIGEAADELYACANRLIEEKGWVLEDHNTRLSDFHEEVKGLRQKWRTINEFEDVHDLREQTSWAWNSGGHSRW